MNFSFVEGASCENERRQWITWIRSEGWLIRRKLYAGTAVRGFLLVRQVLRALSFPWYYPVNCVNIRWRNLSTIDRRFRRETAFPLPFPATKRYIKKRINYTLHYLALSTLQKTPTDTRFLIKKNMRPDSDCYDFRIIYCARSEILSGIEVTSQKKIVRCRYFAE